ncbi:MAG TPA: hypothetical protein PLZ36_14315, partial [Armatimonadota bacterium]|nr:hypothetical protein [Armatimonadota bacterium]
PGFGDEYNRLVSSTLDRHGNMLSAVGVDERGAVECVSGKPMPTRPIAIGDTWSTTERGAGYSPLEYRVDYRLADIARINGMEYAVITTEPTWVWITHVTPSPLNTPCSTAPAGR